MITTFITGLIIFICFLITRSLESYQNKKEDEYKDKKNEKGKVGLYDTGSSMFVSFMTIFVIFTCEQLLIVAIKRLSKSEKNST